MSSLTTTVRTVESLSPDELVVMHELMTAHYDSVPRERFDDDLSRKDEALLLLDEKESIRGFTTLAWNPAGHLYEGDILFSGDTIIDRACWGTQELVRAFCRRAGEWKAANGRSLFWFLISKGYRTYLYLPLFARRFHPHPDRHEPMLEDLAGRVAERMFGECWKPAEGVIRFSNSHGHLRRELSACRDHNPWAAFFLERNPAYASGEELVCITEMHEENLRRLALAAFRQGGGS